MKKSGNNLAQGGANTLAPLVPGMPDAEVTRLLQVTRERVQHRPAPQDKGNLPSPGKNAVAVPLPSLPPHPPMPWQGHPALHRLPPFLHLPKKRNQCLTGNAWQQC